MNKIKIALAGNPNSGKTTIFNNLTGSHQHVGNYGGVTVEVKEGGFRHGNYGVHVVDLPGTYSLTAYSIEEITARDFLVKERPDVVVNVVDGTNLERNLYLTAQLREMGVPLVIAINMADEMKAQGIRVDTTLLSDQLGAAVVSTIGSRNRGTNTLIEAVIETANGKRNEAAGKEETWLSYYDPEMVDEIKAIAGLIEAHSEQARPEGADSAGEHGMSLCWSALKLLENDPEVLQSWVGHAGERTLADQVGLSRGRLGKLYGEDPEIVIAEKRFGLVHGLCRAVVQRTVQSRINISDQVDKVLTHRVLGLPIFAMLMYATFWCVFRLGEAPMGWIEAGMNGLSHWIVGLWPAGEADWLRSLLVDGVISGVGGVLVFIPNIVLLFAAITLLEDTGYMARAAFIMDRLMKWVGLHGKSFIPMLTGFGCTVPAVMGARILDNQRDRLTTILVLPLMSCGARLTIYMLLIPAFFRGQRAAVMMFAIYVIGIVLAVICAKLLRRVLFKGEPSPFVMELPPYRLPTLRAVATHVWQRAWMYIKKAGTVILAISIVLWFLTSYPKLPADRRAGLNAGELHQAELRYSMTGRIGQGLEVVIKPLGFDWRIGTALVGAFAAKEVFVAQMGIVFAVDKGEADTHHQLRQQLRNTYTPLAGFCVMLFCLIAAPCAATVAVVRRETGRWKWALFQFFGLTGIAYVLTLAVYQLGSFLGIGV